MNSSGGSFTQTGVTEMRQAVQQLPAAVTSALRGVAESTARRILADARQRLGGQIKSDRTALINAMAIEEDVANRVYRVVSKPPPGQPGNVPLWNEYGAIGRIKARHYMHDSAAAAEDRYRKDGEQASIDAARKVLG